MEARRQRIAENEVRFRAINEDLRASLDGLPLDGEPIVFVCECGHADCSAPLSLSRDEYEHVRGEATFFAVTPGHEILDVERIVERHSSHLVIQKHLPPGARIAEATNPRG